MKAKTFGLLMFCVAGIYVSYLTQGVVQESMATKRYGKDQVHDLKLSFFCGSHPHLVPCALHWVNGFFFLGH